ncbi:hypothetical protein STZ1_11022 [Bacillus subtilis]
MMKSPLLIYKLIVAFFFCKLQYRLFIDFALFSIIEYLYTLTLTANNTAYFCYAIKELMCYHQESQNRP